jgi:ABC-type sugar transport system ATPase subunit
VSLEIININKSFSKNQILKNISLSINEGEFVVFLGPSGCGKTTLLRIIAGLETEDSGEIFHNGNQINTLDPKSRKIGMVFQNYALYPHLTVAENIAFPLKINKVPKEIRNKKVTEIAEFIGLSEHLHKKPKQLSGGQKQRVALGRAISREPKIFLFDEPLSNLDAKLRSSMRIELYKLHQTMKTTSIYVTHDQIEAMTMGDRIVLLNDGIIQQIGTPQEIYNSPTNLFVAGFIGNPAINLLELDLLKDTNYFKTNSELNECLISSIGFSEAKTLAIRPENFAFTKLDDNYVQFGEVKFISKEFLGNEYIYYFEINNQIKTLTSKEDLEINQQKYVIFVNKSKLLLFDNYNNKLG